MSKDALYLKSYVSPFFSSGHQFNFIYGQQKIQRLAKSGYEFIGSLPSYSLVPTPQKIASFLFVAEGRHYHYKGPHFLQQHDAEETNFLKIQDEHFIYLLVKENTLVSNNVPKSILFLKENAALQGHNWLAGPYNKRPALFYTNELSPFVQNLAQHLQLVDSFPQSAYVLTRDSLFYVIGRNQALHTEKLLITHEAPLENLQSQIQNVLLAADKTFYRIQQEISVPYFDCIQHATGHAPLQHTIIGGEIYFMNGEIKKINNISGSFHSDGRAALTLLQEVFKHRNLKNVYAPFTETPALTTTLAKIR